MISELQRYLFFLLMSICAFAFVLFAVYLLAVIEIASFVFSTLSLGVGSG